MADATLEILLVEDSPSDARLVRLWLSRSALQPRVVTVENGAQAVDYLHGRPPYEGVRRPDLVLLDLNLPKLSGFEVLSEIRSDDQLRRLPVIVLTASAIAEDVHRAHELQADRYLSKPADAEGFKELVEQVEVIWQERQAGPQQ